MSRRARCAPPYSWIGPTDPLPSHRLRIRGGALGPGPWTPRPRAGSQKTDRLFGWQARLFESMEPWRCGTLGPPPRLFWATVIVVAAIGYVQHNVRAWRGGQDDFR